MSEIIVSMGTKDLENHGRNARSNTIIWIVWSGVENVKEEVTTVVETQERRRRSVISL